MRRVVNACILLTFLGGVMALRPMPLGADGSLARLLPPGSAAGSPTTAPAAPELTKVEGRDGFWRIAQDAQGVWWYLSPTGQREFLNTVTTVQPYQHARVTDGARFVSRDWSGGDKDDAGDLDGW